MESGSALVGDLSVPGDKSTTQRALLLGALAEGTTRVRGALDALDTRATASCIEALGARVVRRAEGALEIEGRPEPRSPSAALDCANAGTAARLLLGLLAGRAGRWTIDGDASLRGRPMGRVVAPLAAMGARIAPAGGVAQGAPGGAGDGARLPLVVLGAPLTGRVHEVALPSAQVKSALLLAGLCAQGPTTVVQHLATRDHTERMLPAFGARLAAEPGTCTVQPGPLRAADVVVPGDPSSAAFLVVAAALLPGSELWLRGVGLWPRRTGFLLALARAGVQIERSHRGAVHPDPVGDLRVAGGDRLSAFDIAPADVPDLVDEIPILALAAARAQGTSTFAGLAELRHKESDRVASVAALLDALGVPVEVRDDGLRITGVAAWRRPSRWPALDDHRLALGAAVAARVSGWPLPPIDAADVSWPGFAEALERLSPA